MSYREFYKMAVHPELAKYDCKATKEDEDVKKSKSS